MPKAEEGAEKLDARKWSKIKSRQNGPGSIAEARLMIFHPQILTRFLQTSSFSAPSEALGYLDATASAKGGRGWDRFYIPTLRFAKDGVPKRRTLLVF
jgi:hypothetical protein